MATLINVCGTSRSGSTMLDLMLGNGADAFSCGEVCAWFRPWRPHHFEIDCPCGEVPCPVWSRIKAVPEDQFHATVIRELQVDFVVDSSKDLCWLVDAQRWAAASGLRTYNVLMWKDPIDLAYSFWKRGYGIDFWRKEFVSYHGKILQVGLPFIAVKYDDLVGNLQPRLAQICSAVGLSYFPGKERFWEEEHHYLFGSGGIRRQVEAGKSVIKARTGFPPEFDAHISRLREQVAADQEVQQIMATLRQADVKLHRSDDSDHSQWLPKKPYPWWYYGKRAIGLVRRYIPEQYDDTVHEKVETVPLEQ